MSTAPAAPRPDRRRADALAAAQDHSHSEQALLAVLHDLQLEKDRAADAYHAIVRSLAATLEARDGYTGDHADAVRDLAAGVAVRLGADPAGVEEIRTVALLHDVGKIGIPDHVLHKEGPLTHDEWALMHEHPVIGERILRPLPGMAAIADAVRHEHERWDGSGYPDGLRGDEIPVASRVVLACDAYHAMVSDRPYRRALGEGVARAELRRHAGTQFDPAVVDALLACLDAPEPGVPAPGPVADAPEGSRPESELRALITVAAAVAGAHALEDVLDTAAEEARAALGAASLSISRWWPEHDLLRTLINVGELGPGEERHPTDEVYRLAEFPDLLRMMLRGAPHRASIYEPGSERHEIALLHELGKASSVAIPITYGGSVWGEMYATRGYGSPPFTERDVRFLQAISGQVAAAFGRGEVFSRLAELAYEDPLTGLANRRALDERLERAVRDARAAGEDLALVVCDLDDLKDINDAHGHPAGDEALVAVAGALRAVAARHVPSFVARLSGDEFCLLLGRCDAARARELAERAGALVRRAPQEPTLSSGVASLGTGAERAADLLRAADAALYRAKRTGRARVCAAGDAAPAGAGPSRGRRRARRDRDIVPRRVQALIADGTAALDRLGASAAPRERLEAVLVAAAGAFDAPAWALSHRPPGSLELRTVVDADLRDGVAGRAGPAATYTVADYPATAAVLAGGWFVAGGVHGGDAAELGVLDDFGLDAVLAVGVPEGDAGGAWLLELYADERTLPLTAAAPAVRLLAGYSSV